MWTFWNSSKRHSHAERARRAHEAWLDRAVRTGRQHPRIPTREVRLGGFFAMMQSREGRAHARQWWEHSLQPGSDD
ncbi:MAG: hypothetical protein AAGB48_05360 [Planctomycetota bacterium]